MDTLNVSVGLDRIHMLVQSPHVFWKQGFSPENMEYVRILRRITENVDVIAGG